MAGPADPASLYEAKALAELSDADELAGVRTRGWGGDPMGAIALVTAGEPSDVKNGDGLRDGPVADALRKALPALGFESGSWFVVSSRPGGMVSDPAVRAARLRLAIEAADSPVVMAIDDDGAADLAVAFGLERLEAGAAVRAAGRTLGALGDFALSLHDDRAKGRAWAAMKAIIAASGPGTRARRP